MHRSIDTVATIIAVIGTILTVYVFSLLLHGLIGGSKSFTGFFLQNLIIVTITAAVTMYFKNK